MDEIKVYDNFLAVHELEYARNIIKSGSWTFTRDSYEGGTVFWEQKLMKCDFFREYITQKIKKLTNRNFKIYDVTANGQTYGLDGDFHKDSTREDDYTFLLYIGDITKENVRKCRGYTLFKTGEIVKSIEPIDNRGVLFDSRIEHVGLGPSRAYYGLRVSIAYKLKEVK
jgi:hypothetical protein